VEALADPLVHLVRNAVDHGIESPEDRVKAGKPRAGSVILSAEQEGDHITLTIQDDGKGMDPDVLRKAAVIKGLMDEEAAGRLEDRDCYNLIFAPGFSTAKVVSNVSGRGVGMDVVKTNVTKLRGIIDIETEIGKGSKFIIKLPITLAIIQGLRVKIIYTFLIILMALTVVMSIRSVGLILVIALFSIPPFVAEKFTSNLKQMMLVSMVLAFMFCLGGLSLSYYLDLSIECVEYPIVIGFNAPNFLPKAFGRVLSAKCTIFFVTC